MWFISLPWWIAKKFVKFSTKILNIISTPLEKIEIPDSLNCGLKKYRLKTCIIAVQYGTKFYTVIKKHEILYKYDLCSGTRHGQNN